MATEAEEDWDFRFPAIGDPHHEILDECKTRGWLDVFYNEDCGHLRERPWACHPKGYYQPGVVAVKNDGQILYRWRCVPNRSNMSGAGARPEARYTWDLMRSRIADGKDAPLDRDPKLGAEDLPWWKFLLILTAHGWFLRPRAFPLGRDTDNTRVSPGAMMPRVYGFIALWLLAMVLLPMSWVGVAFVGWLIALTPGLIEIHRQFQNIEEPG
ncbi:MAG: Yip1 family protein [Pseudomonadota bacterium]